MVLASQEGRAPVGDTGRAAAGTPRQAVPAQGPQPADAQAQGPRTRGSPPPPRPPAVSCEGLSVTGLRDHGCGTGGSQWRFGVPQTIDRTDLDSWGLGLWGPSG
jgi:hypothetical protein